MENPLAWKWIIAMIFVLSAIPVSLLLLPAVGGLYRKLRGRND